MDKIKTLLQRPLTAGLVGLAIGLIIGLPILGWGLWPVKWKDADASYLRDDLKKQYLCMVIDSYKVNQNAPVATIAPWPARHITTPLRKIIGMWSSRLVKLAAIRFSFPARACIAPRLLVWKSAWWEPAITGMTASS